MTRKKRPLIDWSEASTKRAAIWFVASLLAIVTSFAGDKDLALQIFMGAGAAAGFAGLVQRDK